MKVAVVIVLLLAVIFAVSARRLPGNKEGRVGKVGCHKFCLARALDAKLDKKEMRSCISTCLNKKRGHDDVVDAMKTMAEFSEVMSEDIQESIAELDEDAQREPIEEDSDDEEDVPAVEDNGEDSEESDSEISNGQQLQATDGLNVRNKPCTDGAKVATVAAGTTLTYTGQSKAGCGYTWYSVKGSFGSGWAASNWLKAVGGGGSGSGSGCSPRASYPLFKQCNQPWSNNKLGSSSTICKVGCLMSSVSMALNGLGKKIEGQASNPGTLNSFLVRNGGYSGNLFIWGSVARFGLSYQGQPTNKQEIKNAVCAGNKIVILNVNQGGHWVLATGVDGDTFRVHDPGYSRSTYSAGEVVRAGVFNIA